MTSVECESLDDGLRRVTPGQERTADPHSSALAGVNTQAVPIEKGRADAHRPSCIPCRLDPPNGITVSWPDCTRACLRQQRRTRRRPARIPRYAASDNEKWSGRWDSNPRERLVKGHCLPFSAVAPQVAVELFPTAPGARRSERPSSLTNACRADLQGKHQPYPGLHITQRFSRQATNLLGQPLLIQRNQL